MSTPTGRKQFWLSPEDICLLRESLRAMLGYCGPLAGKDDDPPRRFTRELVNRMRARLDAIEAEAKA